MPIQLQPRLRIAFASGVEVGVADGGGLGALGAEVGVEERHFAIRRVGVAFDHVPVGISDGRDVVVGVLQVVVVRGAAAGRGIVPADGQRVDVVRIN